MNAIEKLLAQTRAAADQRSRATADEYRALVDAAARGDDLDPVKVAEFLEQYARDVGDFHRDVEHRAGRLDARAKLDARPGAEKKLAAADARLATLKHARDGKLAQLRAEFDAAVKKLDDEHARAAAPHETEKREAGAAIAAARMAVDHLHETAGDELKAEVARCREQIDAANGRADQLAGEVERAERRAKETRPQLVAEAMDAGERTYADEYAKVVGETAEARARLAKAATKRNGERIAQERIARVEAELQKKRDAVAEQRRTAAEWAAEIERIHARMLVV